MKEKKKGWKKTKTYLSQVDEGEQQSVPLEARHRAGPGKPCGKERRIKRAGNSPWSGRLADRWQPGQGEDRGRFSGGRGGGLEGGGGGFGGSAGVDGGWVLGGSRQPLPQSHVSGSATGFVLSLKKTLIIKLSLILPQCWPDKSESGAEYEWQGFCLYLHNLKPMRPFFRTCGTAQGKGGDKTLWKGKGDCRKVSRVGCEATRAFSGFGGKPVNKQLRHSRKRNVWHTETKQAEPGRKPFLLTTLRAFFPSHADYMPAIFISDPCTIHKKLWANGSKVNVTHVRLHQIKNTNTRQKQTKQKKCQSFILNAKLGKQREMYGFSQGQIKTQRSLWGL